MSTTEDGGGPGYIDTLDAKIIQYQYCITKIQSLIPAIQKLAAKATESKELPLVQYAVLLCGSIFAINEGVFSTKLEIIGEFKLFKPIPISISNAVTHIPYDNPDTAVKPLSELPSPESGVKCLKSLEELCYSCLQGYQKRLQQAKITKEKLKVLSPNYFGDLESMLKDQIFDKSDNDLTLAHGLLHKLPEDQSLLEDENYVEASLTDMDIEMIFTITGQLRSTLNHLKPNLIPFQKLRTIPKTQQEEYVKSISDGKYALHKVLMLTLRLNEIYSILRKVGRKIYFSNYQHLYDYKLAFQSSNSNYFKLNLLKEVDELFNATKKNGTLVANLTRFVRQNSKYEISYKTLLDFSNFVNQAYTMLENMIFKFEEFGFNWISSELRFRKVYGLPKKTLIDVFQSMKESKNRLQGDTNSAIGPKKSTTADPRSTKSVINNKTGTSQKKLSESKESKDSSDNLEKFPEIDEAIPKSLEQDLKKLDLNDLLPTKGSRSSSISSLSSNNSSNKFSVNSTKAKPSFQTNRNSMLPLPASKASNLLNQRPNSMLFMNSNSSLSTFPSSTRSEINSAATTTPSGRRRSTSLPISPKVSVVQDNTLKAASGAAAALARSNSLKSPNSPLRSPSGSFSSPSNMRSPSGSIKRLGSQVRLGNGTQQHNISSPSPTSKHSLIVVEEEENNNTTSAKPLTANQRLQLHLRQATKSGALMTQQKETLTSVVFDPSEPSAFNLRRSVESPQLNELSDPPTQQQGSAQSQGTTQQNQPQTRDQVTRRNTRRNSVTPQLGNPASPNNSSMTTINAQNTSASSVSSASSEGNSAGGQAKKVRFTGVPEYSELEDAPTTYANRLLKNFAVFKAPPNKPGFKRKDQLLKTEESLSLRSHLRDSSAGTFSPPPQTGLSKFKNKLL
ncbi:uncharacterized protein AC631_03164 [Debaryomyces fabryi]|uniref:Uncharacterized protein n=1 Tax=Debaryomyces fabryi TaxID=58627 RepID=A0A0V1PXV3_9ASCO|nr:uncharacterized protein AC631_03164 [Debaryomyces fabryi]KSA01096.1 hypothetical protein AC631_03164 [Debaryomyces fabryi]CUM48970.1 unnamed protein product [Debaryomyces fabryi]